MNFGYHCNTINIQKAMFHLQDFNITVKDEKFFCSK